MARYCAEKETESKFAAAKKWRDSCLVGGGSIFSDGNLWVPENFKSLETYFINNPDEGSGDFFSKFESQIASTAPEVKQLAAEMMWFMLLCPGNITPAKKRESVTRVWGWSGSEVTVEEALFSDQVLSGIGSAGTSFNMNRWRELGYFIRIGLAFSQLPRLEREALLADGWSFAEWLEKIPENEARQLRHMILFLLFPDEFERIFGGMDRKAVVRGFTGKSKAEVRKLTALQIDRELAAVRARQVEDYGTDQLDFYISPLKEQWRDGEHKHWLFSWNPDNWDWEGLSEVIASTARGKSVIERWSCSNTSVKPGDRAWLVRLGVPPKGIFAIGNVVSEPYEDSHWDTEKATAGKRQRFVDIEFTSVLDVYKDPFITHDDLSGITIDKQDWSPQSSGIEIKKRSAGLLDKLWGQLRSTTVREPEPEYKTMVAEPTNLIFYGPPGTGKTYELNRLVERYTVEAASISREQWLAQELQSLRWFDVVFMALYSLGGKAKVAEIEQSDFIQQKAKSVGRTKNVKQQIWASLQRHAREDSATVKYSNRHEPYVFDKTADSVWGLVGGWQEACEDQITLAKLLQLGPPNEQKQHRYEFVTFHQAYGYEDFVEGIRPVQDEDSGDLVYRVEPGVFRRICQRAKNDPGHRYALFVDEINRGNVAKIFGELITLIEQDKRAEFDAEGKHINGMALTLPYSGDSFGVPKNLDIYGTMNTADRSIALLDTALRRRFNFKELMPNASIITGSRGDGYIEDGEGGVINLRAMLDAMNLRIRFLLNRDLTLGHAYLCKVKDFKSLREVLLGQFIPLLQEYFYDDWHRIQLVFRDVGADNKKMEPQIIEHQDVKEVDVLGFDHDDFEDLIEYTVAAAETITPDAVRKIYEEQE